MKGEKVVDEGEFEPRRERTRVMDIYQNRHSIQENHVSTISSNR